MPDQFQTTDTSRWALVTGASAGIGQEFCKQLARAGYHLVLVARRADRLHTLATELRQAHGTACLIQPADLSEPGAAASIASQLHKDDIKVEFLVNNAGYGLPGRFVEPDWSAHRDFIQVMMTTVCDLTWRLLPAMQEMKKGYVINVASVAGLVPGSEGHTLYGASKAFLIRFSESLALENRYWGVNVSALCPGFTYSEFHDVSGTRQMADRLPSFMWLRAEEVVRYGIESVTRDKPRVLAIPGMNYRMLVALNRHLPWIGRWSVRRMSNRLRNLD
jgi:short-subunit dehydrogenase